MAMRKEMNGQQQQPEGFYEFQKHVQVRTQSPGQGSLGDRDREASRPLNPQSKFQNARR
jgi:hypothetical protein